MIVFLLESLSQNETQSFTINSTMVQTWFNRSAWPAYQKYINEVACQMNGSAAAYRFCVQDTILSQSPLLGQLTVKSSLDYYAADRSLCK